QPQVNASKLAYNLENCEDSSQSESCGIEELKSNQHDEVITKLEKNIIVEQELKQQLLSPAHTSRSDQTSEEQDPSLDTTQNIVCMFKKANKLGQEAILYWCYFIEKYDKRIDNFVAGGVKKKTATSMVYQEIKQLLPEITDVNLSQKILRARKLYKLFNTLGLEKIKQVSYSTDAISSLNYQQIQDIIDYVNSVTSSHNETMKILHDQSHVTSKINPTNTYIPLKAPQSKPTYDQSYFRSKTLDQYPNLYKECSDGNVDYYGITDNISFPLCRLDHDDIEGEYKDGTYYIKCEQRIVQITA
ncbi:1583_t:CDS:1, partial [Entrophospora sp. SA101]